MSVVYIKKNSNYSQVGKYYQKINSVWVETTQADTLTYLQSGIVATFNPINFQDRFEIGAPGSLTAETCQCLAILNGNQINNGVTWSITTGSGYATIDSAGTLTVLSGANETSITIQASYGTHTAGHTMYVTYLSGSTSETTTETVVDDRGHSTTTTTTITENEDGTTSSESTSVVYNDEGEAIEKTNEIVDVGGNVSTQEIEYDENGNEVVVGYSIDTSEGTDGGKTFNGDGVNTDYYAFDVTRGFILDFNFTIDFSNQPANQDEGHHNILTMKRATPEPWYGFQLRHGGTNKYIQLGTQFETGSNTNTNISVQTVTNNVAEYNLRITYDPTAETNKFVCYDVIKGTNVLVKNSTFPDLPELRYLKVTIGYAMNASGEPYRYSNINVKNFSITKLGGLQSPVISCDGMEVSMYCPTSGTSIYYRLNQTGSYTEYTTPIAITANTVVEAYSYLNGKESDTVTEICEYHNYSLDYLTFEILNSGTIGWRAASSTTKTIQYSLNNGAWTSIDSTDNLTISVSQGDKVRFKGTNNNYANSNTDYSGFGNIGTAPFNVSGNIMSLVYGDNFVGQTELPAQNTFWCLFDGSNVVSAEHLVLPATAMTNNCYRALFANCSLLSVAPKLPATNLYNNCYRAMFTHDISLTRAPELPATTVKSESYNSMFNTCNSLTYIKCLATNRQSNSCTGWVTGVAAAGTFIKDVNASWSVGGDGIPTGWVIGNIGVAAPVVSCETNVVTITCESSGATINYRLNQSGNYQTYSSSFTITADTVVEAYAVLNGETSITTTLSCTYEGVEDPVISCDGQNVTIQCETPSAEIYYRLNQTGSYSEYVSAVEITATTVVESYAVLGSLSSQTVSATCVYNANTRTPEITCDGEYVTITCATNNADIYYRLNQTGNYEQYATSFAITADTVVESYAIHNQSTSATVSATCVYAPVHDYANDYLTFKILSGGTIVWQAFGSGFNKVIQYSINDGAWTPITAQTGTSVSFTVSANDTVRFKGSNNTYSSSKANYDGFEGGTAYFNIEGNIMSMVYGDNFIGNTALTGTYNFCSMFKKTNVISAENLILPSVSLTNYCYRALFSWATGLIKAPELPATTLAQGCYWYMFEQCAITTAPELEANTLPREGYGHMFEGCSSLNYIKCLTVSGLGATSGLTSWVSGVSATGIFVKDSNTTWATGPNGIPSGWNVYNDEAVLSPVISFDGEDEVEISCGTTGANIYYRLNETGDYSAYTSAFTITATTLVESYSVAAAQTSATVSMSCEFVSSIPFEASNRTLGTWSYNNTNIQTPYSVNAIDGHSSSYARGSYNFETTVTLREAQPTYLWFQHADQSASIYVDNTLVEKHWGGYISFFTDISNYVHSGSNQIKVTLRNNEGNNLAPASGDFNFNATLGNVKLFTSPVLPDMSYGYDGFHVTSTVSDSSATVTVTTSIPSGATVVCTITGGTYTYTNTKESSGDTMSFTTTISNPHLWNGTIDPFLYMITLEIYHDNELYHRYQRPYGLRYFSYVINDTSVLPNNEPYTGFLLNGSPYLLRGVCMHDDLAGKANALNDADYAQEFAIIQELGCNFIRLAHYPHPKEVYDWCDRLGIIVQTEAPCVNKLQSTMPEDYYTHLETQYRDLVNQHYNHPCIVFWGLSNETTTDDKAFGKEKIEGYTTLIKSLDSSRMVGYVMSHSYSDPLGYYNNPDVDWVGGNIYVGWYIDKASNDPTNQLTARTRSTITQKNKALAFSEYGGGGTQHCHSEDPQSTTTKGNYERHDIEYQMWLHEGHIAAIRNFPELLFTAEWQLFDIAVSNRNEGYTVCLDGENATTDDNLRRLNNKGLVERDHVTKKDSFYIYKAEWNPTPFVHICGKDYTRKVGRAIKCYTNDPNNGKLSLYVNNTFVEEVTVTNNIALFTAYDFNSGDVVRVDGSGTSDTFTFS